jgi:PAS domain S-box-containing protein
MASLNCHKNDDGLLEKIMYLAFDSTEEIKQNQKKDRIIESIDNSGLRFELDVNGNFHDYNTNFIRLLKSSQKDLKSIVVFDIIEPIELDSFNKSWDNIIKGNRQDGITRIKSPDGREIVLQGSYIPLNNASHEVNRVVFTGHDISAERLLEIENKKLAEALKRHEKAMKDSEKEMAARIRELRLEHQNIHKETERHKRLNEGIMDESPDAIVTTGHDNRISFFNKEAEKLWKMKRQDVIGQDVNVLFSEKQTEENELLGSFVRPGDHKILGKKSRTFVTDSVGKEKPVVILLGKIRIESENFFTAFLQSLEI